MQQLSYATIAGLVQAAEKAGVPLSHLVLADKAQQLERTPQSLWEQMDQSLAVMEESAQMGMRPDIRSTSGLTGGDAARMQAYAKVGSPLAGGPFARAVARALAVSEYNAAMGRIVAAPTAGSSGVVPGVLLALKEEYHLDDADLLPALYNASAVGYLAMRNATVAGAVGGCQAEVGVASAMAASAAVELMGGTPTQCLDAASTSLMNLLGLVCDPVGGLVEYPCQNRNAIGVAGAITAAELALSGVKQLIPFDEMLAAMYNVGRRLAPELRETAKGGCAVTPAGCAAARNCHGCR